MGPCTANARRPTVESWCRGTTISCCVADMSHPTMYVYEVSIFYQPAVHVLLYTRHREGAVQETSLASCAQAPSGFLAVRQGASRNAHSGPPAVP